MKRLSAVLFAFIVFINQAQCQDSLKALKNNFSTELNVNPFQGNLNLNNALQQIKVRYYTANNIAMRFAISVNSKKSDNKTSNVYGTNPTNFEDNKKSATVGLNAGLEKHFKGTRRLSPYIGSELAIANKSSSQKIVNGTISETTIEGAWQAWSLNGNQYSYSFEERGFFKYGLNLITGFDYYISRNFYFGYEFTFQLSKTKYRDIDVTTKSNGTSTTNNTDYTNKDSFIGPNLINGFRLGFVF